MIADISAFASMETLDNALSEVGFQLASVYSSSDGSEDRPVIALEIVCDECAKYIAENTKTVQ